MPFVATNHYLLGFNYLKLVGTVDTVKFVLNTPLFIFLAVNQGGGAGGFKASEQKSDYKAHFENLKK